MATTLSTTTLAALTSKSASRLKLASVSGVTVKDYLFVDKEVCLVTAVDSTRNEVDVQRGYMGTVGAAHPSGALVYHGEPELFSLGPPVGTYVASEVVAIPTIDVTHGKVYRGLNDAWVEVNSHRLANQRCEDPDTGYEYLLIDSGSALTIGEWVVIDPDGLATQLATTSKGRVGILVEEVSASDTLAWAIVVGSFASALATSDVTTAADLIAAAGHVNTLTSTGGNIVFRASATAAPSTATSPAIGGAVATVYVDNAWVSGEVHSWSSVGG